MTCACRLLQSCAINAYIWPLRAETCFLQVEHGCVSGWESVICLAGLCCFTHSRWSLGDVGLIASSLCHTFLTQSCMPRRSHAAHVGGVRYRTNGDGEVVL